MVLVLFLGFLELGVFFFFPVSLLFFTFTIFSFLFFFSLFPFRSFFIPSFLSSQITVALAWNNWPLYHFLCGLYCLSLGRSVCSFGWATGAPGQELSLIPGAVPSTVRPYSRFSTAVTNTIERFLIPTRVEEWRLPLRCIKMFLIHPSVSWQLAAAAGGCSAGFA